MKKTIVVGTLAAVLSAASVFSAPRPAAAFSDSACTAAANMVNSNALPGMMNAMTRNYGTPGFQNMYHAVAVSGNPHCP